MKTVNINVGVLGHVDSGKTSLAKALSTVASTSAFDKNPQSKRRGITLDLGFSSFEVDVSHRPEATSLSHKYDKIQFTLVDCPGHGSLIRTILCGAQIIDIMLLVIDVTKGFQTQTAECLVIGDITCSQMLVVLNKCDLLPEATRVAQIEKMKKRVLKTLEPTRFRDAPVAVVSAAPGGTQMDFHPSTTRSENPEIQALIDLLLRSISDPSERRLAVSDEKFLFAVDHCFSVTGQGTVMTGTVLAGTVRVGETIELPQQRIQKKIKSIQMFHQPVSKIGPGDRAGVCVAQLDPGLLERGLVGAPGAGLLHCHACLLSHVHKIAYFKSAVCSKSRFHVFVGHETALARLTFFRLVSSSVPDGESVFVDSTARYEYLQELPSEETAGVCLLLEFDQAFVCPPAGVVIGARLDSTSPTACRLAFCGRIGLQLTEENYRQTRLPKLCVYNVKQRHGQIERITDARTCIVRGLFKRETNWDIFVGLRASLAWRRTPVVANGDGAEAEVVRFDGRIGSSFGQSGKCRLNLDDDLPEELVKLFSHKNKTKAAAPVGSDTADSDRSHVDVVLEFKRHLFDTKQRIMQ